MHEISVIVATDFDSTIVASALPGTVRVRARHGWWVVPLGPGVAMDLLGDELIIPDLEDPNQAAELPRVLAPLTETLCRLPLQGAIALAFTQYFGGTGAQAAAVVKEHSVVFGPAVQEGAINAALERLGVQAEPGRDPFDTVGLAEWRSMESPARVG